MKTKVNRSVVLIAGMLIQLCAGIIYMWSVFRKPVAEHLEWDLSKASLTSSIMLAAFVAGIIIGGNLQDKFGPKKIVILGSVMISVGMIFTALVPTELPSLIFLTYGIIGGLGVGFVYTTTVSITQKWYPDKRGFATGMMVSAFGFSLVLFAPLTTVLLSKKGVPFTFVSIGIIFLIICVLCSLLIDNPSSDFTAKSALKPKADVTKRDYTTAEMLKTPQFYFIALSLMCILPAYFILNPLFKDMAQERGLSETFATIGVMITGIASAMGRLVFPWLSDVVGRKGSIFSIIGITLATVLMLTFAKGNLFLVCIGIIAFTFGGAAGVYPAVTADHFGTKHMGMNYGCVMIGFGTSAIVFPMISNEITKNNNYTSSFVLAAATCIIAFILVLLIKRPKSD